MRKEFLQLVRDPNMLRAVLIAPMIQLFVLSYAINTDLKNIRLVVLDQDHSAESRALISAFHAGELFIPAGIAESPEALETELHEGRADMTLWIPRDFAAELTARKHATLAITVDGQNSSSAGRSLGYTEQIIRKESIRLADQWGDKNLQLRLSTRRIEAATRFFYNPELQSRYYMIPGIMAILLVIISAMLAGMAIVREKEMGTLEQLLVSPLTHGEIIAGKLLPFLLLALVELVIATTLAIVWFHVPFRGSFLLYGIAALCFLLVTLGGGVLVSTFSQTQQQAMLTIWFFMIFAILTSGFFYPIENMPRAVQYLTYINPMRYFMAILRTVFLRGAGFMDVLPNLFSLVTIGLLSFTVAILRFRRRLS
jgi:ABC-2 type transport system permease protein